MKTLKIILASLMFVSAILVVSCKKSSDTPVTNPSSAADNDVSGATDNTLSENTSNDVVQIGAEATDNSTLSNFRLTSTDESQSLSVCATVTPDSATHSVTVSFNGDTCMDGRVRSGSITYDFTGSPAGAHYRTPGFTYTASSSNYVVDGNPVTVHHTVLNTTPSNFSTDSANETWSIIGSLVIIRPNGDTINWSCSRTKTLQNTWTSGIYRGQAIPINWAKARVAITGSASGSRSGGESFTVVIDNSNPMVRDFGSCRIFGKVPFILGKLTYTPSNKKYPRYIDYGAPNNGACDLLANVTINGITYLIYLP